jgi:hypothetical protein
MQLLKNLLAKLAILLQKEEPIVPDVVLPPAAPITITINNDTPVSPAPHVSQIPNLAQGIFEAEGGSKAYGFKYNNPGDLKFTGYTESLGAIGQIGANFCIFDTMEIGEKACIQLITDAATNKLIDYHDCTINKFIETYAQPPVLGNYVATALGHIQKVGITGNSFLSELL